MSCPPPSDTTRFQCDFTQCNIQPNTVQVTPNPNVVVQPPTTQLCSSTPDHEYGIVTQYVPGPGQTVGAGGQVKVWVSDENQLCTGWSLGVDLNSGLATGFSDTATDGFPYIAMYLGSDFSNLSASDPHWAPNYVWGEFDNNNGNPYSDLGNCRYNSTPSRSAGYEQPAVSEAESYNVEYVWNVDDLHLAANNYAATFMIWDGDHDRAVACVNIALGTTGTITTQQQGTAGQACLAAGTNPLVNTIQVKDSTGTLVAACSGGADACYTFDPASDCFQFSGKYLTDTTLAPFSISYF